MDEFITRWHGDASKIDACIIRDLGLRIDSFPWTIFHPSSDLHFTFKFFLSSRIPAETINRLFKFIRTIYYGLSGIGQIEEALVSTLNFNLSSTEKNILFRLFFLGIFVY